MERTFCLLFWFGGFWPRYIRDPQITILVIEQNLKIKKIAYDAQELMDVR